MLSSFLSRNAYMPLAVCLLTAWNNAEGQTGPAGVGNSTDNKVWLDASRLTSLSNGSRISQWTDISGNNWHANQGILNNRPTYLTSSLNGKPVIHFERTPATQYLEITSVGVGNLMSNSNTVIAVAKANTGTLDNSTNSAQSIIHAPGHHSGIRINGYPNVTSVATSQWFEGTVPSSTPSEGFNTVSNIGQNTWGMIVFMNQENSAGTTHYGFHNSVAMSYWPTGSGYRMKQMTNYANNIVRIGASNASGGYSWPLNGDIAEVILYNISLNNAQRVIVENYLSAKYNLPIANKFYTDNTDYNQDVQGIGTTNGIAKHSQAGNSKGLILTETNGSLDATNEFVFAGHNASSNALVTSDLLSPVAERWQRSWYVQKSGTIDAKLSFDWSQAGLTPDNLVDDLSQYVLLYRPNLGSSFGVINNTSLIPLLENEDQIAFILPHTSLQNGYYTLGKKENFMWTGIVSSDWHTAGNWSLNRVPTNIDHVTINSCSTCPVLSTPVQVGSLLVNGGQLGLNAFTLSAAGGARLRAAKLISSGATVQAADFWEVKDCTVTGNLLLRKTGNSNNAWFGNNTYRGKLIIVNQGTGAISPATHANDMVTK